MDHLSSLPVQLTGFVGREREVAEIQRLIGGTRLLTLTGAGGSGKTRLAVEAAARLAGEVAIGWAELAGLSDPTLVAQQVAEQLGVREERTDSASRALVERLRDRAVLLVLDNCEHVVDAAARLVDELLRGCPSLRVLATSREPLGIGGERAWLVPPLSLPVTGDAADSDAVRLFVERAQDAQPAFHLDGRTAVAVAEICRRLDGLPLAIELAAARVRVLPAEQIVARLHDAFRLLASGSRTAIPRHQTLRATIDWSYALLAPDEQRLLDRLSAFSGGFTLEAAEAVCGGDGVDPAAVLDLLARLVDRSLVTMREVAGSARYALLETVRQYAAERLRDAAPLRARHAAFFAALVAAAEPHLTAPARPPWLERIHRDLDNVRQALAWTRDADPAAHLTLTGQLCWFWFSTGFWSEGRGWSERALARSGPEPARAATLFAAAVIATLQADTATAHAWLDECLAIARAHGDARLEAYANNYLGMVLVQQGRADSEAPIAAAQAWFRAHGDLYGLRLSLLLSGSLYTAQGAFERARAVLEEGVAVARTFGLPRELGIALQMLGWAALRHGAVERAASLFHESLAHLRRDPQHLFLARSLEMIGAVAASRGDAALAARLFGAGAAARARIGAGMMHTDRVGLAPWVDGTRERLGADAFAAAWADGERLGLDEALDVAMAQPAPAAEVAAPAPVEATAPILRVRALGGFEVALGDTALAGEAWTSAKARELLVYFLCHPAGRTREQIGVDFWPDASTAQVKNSFHVLLHRLRKAVGRADVVVLDDERYRINPALAPWFDAAVFEREARAGRADAARLEQALALYRGDLLEAESAGDWHVEHAERLRARFHEALSALADLRRAAGDLDGATDALERLVAADDLREDATRRLMICLARAGHRDRALERFDRLAAALRADLGAAPERATVTLRDRIRRAEDV